VLFKLGEDLGEHGQALCATVAGGCGQAEALAVLFEVLFELVEDLRELGEVLRLDGAPEYERGRSSRARGGESRTLPAICFAGPDDSSSVSRTTEAAIAYAVHGRRWRTRHLYETTSFWPSTKSLA
jgi:hypothetical protein